jgi:hypothetical protein
MRIDLRHELTQITRIILDLWNTDLHRFNGYSLIKLLYKETIKRQIIITAKVAMIAKFFNFQEYQIIQYKSRLELIFTN